MLVLAYRLWRPLNKTSVLKYEVGVIIVPSSIFALYAGIFTARLMTMPTV